MTRSCIVAFALSGSGALCACAGARQPPAAELLVATVDSSYWITSDRRGLRMRGAPMVLARVDGRFRELYVADDDRSFYDAVLVGQRLFARDLVRGDSLELFADTVVPRIAREYAAANPREEPLRPDEEATDRPHTTATADIEVLDVHGPFVSYEYRADVEASAERGNTDRHALRRGVLDLRTGKPMTLAVLFGREAAERAIAEASAEWASARDSVLSLGDERSRRARLALGAFTFDAASFSIAAKEREPQVVFVVPGEVRGGSARPVELTPRALPAAPWWLDVRDELPVGRDSALLWRNGALDLVARSRGEPDRARLALSDTSRREWEVGAVTTPVQRVIWLDASVSAEARRALRRAFNEAALYGDETRVARAVRRAGRTPGAVLAASPSPSPSPSRRVRGRRMSSS